MRTKTTKEEQAWIHAIDLLHDRVQCEYDENGTGITAGGEDWVVTNYKYSSHRHYLAVEFDGGDFYVVLEYSTFNLMLNIRAWQDRRMVSDSTEPAADDEGLDEYSVLMLQMVYMPAVGARTKPEKSLMLRDGEQSLVFARPAQVTLFAHLVGILEESVGIQSKKWFDFRTALEYAEKQQTLLAAFELMKRGMVDSRERLRQDWGSLSDC